MRHRILRAAATAALACTALWTWAADGSAGGYPTRPITVIVPIAAGGPTDAVTRAVMQEVSRRLGQPIVIENRPGANGQIATKVVADAAPDGYTFGVVLAAHALNPSLYSKLPYDEAAVTGVAMLGKYPMLMLASSALPIDSLGTLRQYAAKSSGPVTFASTGQGSLTHLLTERISRRLDIPMTHVPYRGNSAAMADLFSGRIALTFDTVLLSEQNVKAGKVKALAISGARRSPLLPEVPTLSELGYPDLETYGWIAVIAPSRLPLSISDRFAQDIAAAASSPEVKKVLDANSLEMTGGTPASTNAFIAQETATWRKVIQAANFKLD
ncbi:MAG: tripartite tricarboxylate transporter substrate-binding protein [Bordetella sp.]|nr:tripartite tricarboxylate transporter substrate-binding protein [Bordetella sp.]